MSAKNNSPDWEAIKAEYLLGGISQQKLADKHGIPRSTLQLHIKKGNWKELRENAAAQADEKLTEKIADIQADANAKIMEMRQQALLKAYELILENLKKHPTGAGSKTVRETVKVKTVKLDDGEEKKVPLKSMWISDIEASIRSMHGIDKMLGFDAASQMEKLRLEIQREQAKASQKEKEAPPDNNLFDMLMESMGSVNEDAIPEIQSTSEFDGDVVE